MPNSSRSGIAFALAAIALWSTLAAVTAVTLHGVPVFLLLAISLAGGGLTLLGVELARGRGWRRSFGGGARAWALGLWGIFGYHAFLYGALAAAGGAQVAVNLVNYLWPLSLVAFAGMLEGGFRGRAVAGAVIGLAGAMLAIGGRGLVAVNPAVALGAGLALAAAITWGGFSALLPRVRGAQGRMAGWCLAGALCSGALALVAQPDDAGWPSATGWAAALYLGIGPLGLAFTAWEAALSRTSGQVIGALAYLAPPISTVLLAAATGEPLTWSIAVAMVLVVGGAALGASARRKTAAAD